MDMDDSLVLVQVFSREHFGTAMNKLCLPLAIKQNENIKTSNCTNRVSMFLDRSHYGGKIKYSGFFCNKFKYASRIWTLARLTGGSPSVIMISLMIKSSIYLSISL